jgi:phosphohistidine phosphatase
MDLYILRHAIAMDKKDWKKADSERPLTKEGLRKMKKAARGMRALLHVDWIITSPSRRAYDTAIIAAKELKVKKRIRVIKALASDGDPKALVRHLGANFRTWESVMLVGHEPYLGRLIGVLTTGVENAGPQLEKGGLAKLSTDSLNYKKCAVLEWLLTPKILKKIA